jgi:hypothetical protein
LCLLRSTDQFFDGSPPRIAEGVFRIPGEVLVFQPGPKKWRPVFSINIELLDQADDSPLLAKITSEMSSGR